MTTLYAMIIEDTHSDVDVQLYVDKTAAVDAALDIATKYAYAERDIEIKEIGGYLAFIQYSPESRVAVVAREVHE
jgi:exoribonuclease II